MEDMSIDLDPESGVHRLTVGSAKSDKEVIYGSESWLKKLRHELSLVGPTEAKVIITGETGTGKTKLAKAIHLCNRERATRTFRRTNVGALVPELAASQLYGHVKGAFTNAVADHTGVVEESYGGTFFMDEVAAAADSVQVMLLTLLETKKINKVGAAPHQAKDSNARFIAATTLPINDLRDLKSFRKDLFFRISEYHIAIPPLRDSPQEIAQLAQHFLVECQDKYRTIRFQKKEFAALKAIEGAAIERLQRYRWPGNVRELQSVIHTAVVRSREDPRETILRARHLPSLADPEPAASGISNFDEYPTWKDAKEAFHREWMEWALRRCGTAAEVGHRFRVDQKTIRKYRGEPRS
jgi:DNA-binding NtrC family response regulator